MGWPVSARFHSVLGGAHTAQTRVDVYSLGKLEASEVPFKDGSVSDQWATVGTRRNLSLTVPDTRWWTAWLNLPGLELQPHGGVSYGQMSSEMCPLGVFPVLKKPRNLIPGSLSLTAMDRWGARVAPAGLLSPQWSTSDLTAAESVRKLITDTGNNTQTEVAVTSTMGTPSVLWKDRQEAIKDLVEAFAGEVFFDRIGVCKIKDRGYVWPVVTIRPGVGGTMVDVVANVDLEPVINEVSVATTLQGVTFDPVILAVTDPSSPAYHQNVGHRAKAVTSSALENRDQAYLMCRDILLKGQAASRVLSGSMVPDFSIDSGDVLDIHWQVTGEPEFAGLQQLTTPLRDGAQTFTTVDVRGEVLV